jgi:oligoribonuclease
MKKALSYPHFVWTDFKTTGDDPLKDTITEASIIITDGDMNIIDKNEFNSEFSNTLEKDMIAFIKSVVPEGVKPPIAGQNVSAIDRPFIRVHLQELEKECLHYRNLDTSSLSLVIDNLYPNLKMPSTKSTGHGIDNIKDSIKSIKFLKKNVFKSKEGINKSETNPSDTIAKTPYFIWTDLETTGLEPLDHKIIEIATIITDGHLNIINQNSFQEIIKINQDTVEEGSPIAIKMHRDSGLLNKCLNASNQQTLKNAEERVINFINTVIPSGIQAPLAGNSIGSLDKPFIKVHMPNLNTNHLNSLNLDVTSFTMLAKNFLPGLEMPVKKRNHLAMEDIVESINELKFLKDNVLKPSSEVHNKSKLKR